jgi:hypothetical protein
MCVVTFRPRTSQCDPEGTNQPILLKPKRFAILRNLVEHAGRLGAQDELSDPKKPLLLETLPPREYQVHCHDSGERVHGGAMHRVGAVHRWRQCIVGGSVLKDTEGRKPTILEAIGKLYRDLPD